MRRVLVLGNACVDLLLRVPRLPHPGETLMAEERARAPGGKGLNQAVVAARAGAAVSFRAPIGDDPDGRLVAEILTGEGFASLELLRVSHATDVSVILVGLDGENSIVSAGSCADALSVSDAESFAQGAVAGDLLLLQGSLSEAATLAAAGSAVARGVQVVLNMAPLRWPAARVLPHCAVAVANEGEAIASTGCGSAGEAALRLCTLGAAVGIVTLGAAGCLCADPTGVRFFPAASSVRVADTTGAGDTFCGVLAAALACGIAVPDAISASQQAAALTVERLGAFSALPRSEELTLLFAGRWRPGASKSAQDAKQDTSTPR